jgi:hypothetical protein
VKGEKISKPGFSVVISTHSRDAAGERVRTSERAISIAVIDEGQNTPKLLVIPRLDQRSSYLYLRSIVGLKQRFA